MSEVPGSQFNNRKTMFLLKFFGGYALFRFLKSLFGSRSAPSSGAAGRLTPDTQRFCGPDRPTLSGNIEAEADDFDEDLDYIETDCFPDDDW